MMIRNVVSTLALALSTLAPVTAAATASKGKTVKFKLANKTAAPMTVLIDDQPVTLAANSETPVRAAEGSDIYGDDHSTVKLHVTGDLSGNTVSFR